MKPLFSLLLLFFLAFLLLEAYLLPYIIRVQDRNSRIEGMSHLLFLKGYTPNPVRDL